MSLIIILGVDGASSIRAGVLVFKPFPDVKYNERLPSLIPRAYICVGPVAILVRGKVPTYDHLWRYSRSCTRDRTGRCSLVEYLDVSPGLHSRCSDERLLSVYKHHFFNCEQSICHDKKNIEPSTGDELDELNCFFFRRADLNTGTASISGRLEGLYCRLEILVHPGSRVNVD